MFHVSQLSPIALWLSSEMRSGRGLANVGVMSQEDAVATLVEPPSQEKNAMRRGFWLRCDRVTRFAVYSILGLWCLPIVEMRVHNLKTKGGIKRRCPTAQLPH